MQLVSLQMNNSIKFKDKTWDFRKAFTKCSNHGFHTYPAMMIPQVARKLIEMYGKDKEVLLDPFMGSGTALLEATLHTNFKSAYGIDINPLALLISTVKTTPIYPNHLKKSYHELLEKIKKDKELDYKNKLNIEKPIFFNIDFWFKPEVITDLTIIKNNIKSVKDEDIKNFFFVAFSETVRNVSNTRNREYKLYRMSPKRLKSHNPNAIEEFSRKTIKNISNMTKYWKECNKKCKVNILAEDTRLKTSIPVNSVDLIVTSPPYGDSRTTVAYGQFSRLALQWLDYDKKTVTNIDKISLGGKPTKDLIYDLKSPTLQKIINKIANIDEKRARDVLSFYIDFNKCIKELDSVTKVGANVCFVVGNRTVKGVQIPTDEIIVELFQAKNHYKHHKRGIH